MMAICQLHEWAATFHPDSQVFVDEGGLCLRVRDYESLEEAGYLELGGEPLPEDDLDENGKPPQPVPEAQRQSASEEVQEILNMGIASLIHVINGRLKKDGDTSETSQRMNCLNALKKFEHTVNGITDADMLTWLRVSTTVTSRNQDAP